jgi:glucose-6-phosphate isomerase
MSQKNNTPTIPSLLGQHSHRRAEFAVGDHYWHFDYSNTPLTKEDRAGLCQLLTSSSLVARVSALFDGQCVNLTESQPARHMMLRAAQPTPEVAAQRIAFLDVADSLHRAEPVADLLHIGIGGSDLGPRLVAEALAEGVGGLRVHWLSTMDGRRFEQLTRQLDPRRTGVVIASKSFATEETLIQAQAARAWLGEHFASRAWACTAQPRRATEFGIHPEHILAFPQWTGGRFSLWSSIGVSAAASIGRTAFERMLAGARAADDAFRRRPDEQRLAVIMALLMHYLRRQLDLPTLGFISYEPRLALLGDYLQQLIMESLGKGVDLEGRALASPTTPLIFGGRGTDLQHSIFQALHQGLDTHPLVLIGALEDDHAYPDWHRRQLAHLLAQAKAFAYGRSEGPPHQRLPGNRPVCLLLTERLSPEALGYLLASFEHAVFVLSVLWRINPFDQWGVEEGKRLAQTIYPKLGSNALTLERFADLGFED